MAPVNPSLIRPASVTAVVVAFAAGIRVGYALLAPAVDPFLRGDPLYGDAAGYQVLASNLLAGRGLTWDGITPTSFRMPGYPVFLALVYAVIGPNAAAARLVQAMLGALTCIPVAAVAKRLGGDKAALLAASGLAVHPLLVYLVGWLYAETLFTFLLWVGVWLLVRGTESASRGHAMLAGAAFGLATLVRPDLALLPAFIGLAAVLVRQKRRLLAGLAAAQLVLLLTILPWSIRNAVVHRSLVPLSTNSGTNLYAANNVLADGGLPRGQSFLMPGMSELESDRYFTRQAVRWIADHPTDYLRLVPVKLSRFFSPIQTKSAGCDLGAWLWPAELLYAVFLLLAAVGAIAARGHPVGVLVGGTIGWFAVLAAIYAGGTRAALPVVPGFVILAANALAHGWGLRRTPESLTPHSEERLR